MRLKDLKAYLQILSGIFMLGELEIIAITLAAAAISAAAQYVFKRNVGKFEFDPRHVLAILTNWRMLLGLGMYAASFILYIYALHAAPQLSFVYSIFASTFVFVLLISRYALGERINAFRAAGMLLIVLGITLVALTYTGGAVV
jgi:multidrug transporter EmrE-like cation transporter